MCEKHNFQLTESLTTQRVANAELSTEVEYLRRMRDRNKATAGAESRVKLVWEIGENAY